MMVRLLPIPHRIPPKAPKFWDIRSDFKPSVTDEEKVVGPPFQSGEVRSRTQGMISVSSDDPEEDIPEDFGRQTHRYVQHGAFKLDCVSLALSYLFLRVADQLRICFWAHTSGSRLASGVFESLELHRLTWMMTIVPVFREFHSGFGERTSRRRSGEGFKSLDSDSKMMTVMFLSISTAVDQ